MKLISLNIAHGQHFEPLIKFIDEYSQRIDVFCLQEVMFGENPEFTTEMKARINLFTELQNRLGGFEAKTYYAPENARYFYHERLPKNTRSGLAVFTRKAIKVKNNGGFRCYERENLPGVDYGAKLTGNCQWLSIQKCTIMNLHGLYQRDTSKADTTERIKQSEILINFIESRKGKKVLCGDFNLLPQNRSLKILERKMVNLIKEFNIKSTRSGLYSGSNRHANYLFVSPDVKVNDFRVLEDEVSDHLPLFLEFQL